MGGHLPANTNDGNKFSKASWDVPRCYVVQNNTNVSIKMTILEVCMIYWNENSKKFFFTFFLIFVFIFFFVFDFYFNRKYFFHFFEFFFVFFFLALVVKFLLQFIPQFMHATHVLIDNI